MSAQFWARLNELTEKLKVMDAMLVALQMRLDEFEGKKDKPDPRGQTITKDAIKRG